MSSRTLGCGALGLAVLCAGTSPLLGGSVFMKNGYIIHGPVVERSSESIVLGWANGKVKIHKRFIESVTYEPGEEQQLEALAVIRREEAQAAEAAVLEASVAEGPVEELPADIETFLEKYAPELSPRFSRGGLAAGGESHGGAVPEVVVADPGLLDEAGDAAAGTEPDAGREDLEEAETGVDVLEPPRLADRIVDTARGVALRPPEGWEVAGSDVAFQILGPADGEGFRPSINVVSLERGGTSWEECQDLLRRAQQETLVGFEVLDEGPRALAGGATGYEVVGRGALGGRALVVRQLLISTGDRLWLLSGFSVSGPGSRDFALIEESAATFTPGGS